LKTDLGNIYTTIHADNLPVSYFYFGIGLGLKL
jgi:hypothetical protein